MDLATAKGFIGMNMPGNIVRVSTDPYEYTVQSTGEVIMLAHRYDYVPEETKVVATGAPVSVRDIVEQLA